MCTCTNHQFSCKVCEAQSQPGGSQLSLGAPFPRISVSILRRRTRGSEKDEPCPGHTAVEGWGCSLKLVYLLLKLTFHGQLPLETCICFLLPVGLGHLTVDGRDGHSGGILYHSLLILPSPDQRFSNLGSCCVTLGKSLPSLSRSFFGYEMEAH